jgi:hypothetical protein
MKKAVIICSIFLTLLIAAGAFDAYTAQYRMDSQFRELLIHGCEAGGWQTDAVLMLNNGKAISSAGDIYKKEYELHQVLDQDSLTVWIKQKGWFLSSKKFTMHKDCSLTTN